MKITAAGNDLVLQIAACRKQESEPHSRVKEGICNQSTERGRGALFRLSAPREEVQLSKTSETTWVGTSSGFLRRNGNQMKYTGSDLWSVVLRDKFNCSFLKTSLMRSCSLKSSYLVPFEAFECCCVNVHCSARVHTPVSFWHREPFNALCHLFFFLVLNFMATNTHWA